MEDTVLGFAAPVLVLIGLTQLYVTERWQGYYRWLTAMGAAGVRFNGLVSLALGSPIVVLHNVWSGPPLLLTIFGWLLLSESALCLFVPGTGLAGLAEVEDGTRGKVIKVTGAAFVIVGGVLTTHLLAASG
jgi:uncharacterized protein YjeT (DUF2065 family)